MKRCLATAALSSLLLLPAAAQKPASDQQQHTISTAREIAIHYTSRLPDFICAENVTRTDSTGPNNMKADRLTIQLSYFGQREKYQLVAINGNKTNEPIQSLDGLISGGEFGSLLSGIFDPNSAAEFQWKESTTLRKQQAVVYTYRITRAQSHYVLGRRTQDGNMVSAPAGYHGQIVLDSGTAHVLRLTADADDIPKDSGILQSSVTVDYDFIDVAGHKYLLPSKSESHMERSHRQIGNVVTFTGYRKFAADSSIDFHAPEW